MKVEIRGKIYHIREDLPGTIQFVETDKKGRIVSTLESLAENVPALYGETVAAAVSAYLNTAEHLVQILTDYGWTEMPGADFLFMKRTIQRVEYIQITAHDPMPAQWHHWVEGQAVDKNGDRAMSLWRFVMPVGSISAHG